MIVLNDRIASAYYSQKTNGNNLDTFKAYEQGVSRDPSHFPVSNADDSSWEVSSTTSPSSTTPLRSRPSNRLLTSQA
jgi:L-asparaginase/Glu-tRNA(Gln) amidotransferase subunit D